MKPIVVIGDLILDILHDGVVERMSPEEPSSPIFRVTSSSAFAGGAANVACNLATLGSPCVLIGLVGTAPVSNMLANVMVGNVKPLVYFSERKTTVKTRHIVDGKQVFRSDVETTTALDPRDERNLISAIDKAVPEAAGVVVSDYAKGVAADEVGKAAIRLARAHNIPVVVDAKRPDRACFAGATVLKPNLREIADALGVRQPMDEASVLDCAYALLRRSGAQHVVLTLGAAGMVVASRAGNHRHFIDAHAVTVKDVIGAGDTVAAALTFALVHGAPVLAAASFANAAAAIAVQRRGPATPTLEEISEIYEHPYGDEAPALDGALGGMVH